MLLFLLIIHMINKVQKSLTVFGVSHHYTTEATKRAYEKHKAFFDKIDKILHERE